MQPWFLPLRNKLHDLGCDCIPSKGAMYGCTFHVNTYCVDDRNNHLGLASVAATDRYRNEGTCILYNIAIFNVCCTYGLGQGYKYMYVPTYIQCVRANRSVHHPCLACPFCTTSSPRCLPTKKRRELLRPGACLSGRSVVLVFFFCCVEFCRHCARLELKLQEVCGVPACSGHPSLRPPGLRA